MNREKSFRRHAMGGGSNRTLETDYIDDDKYNQIVVHKEVHNSFGNMPLPSPKSSTGCDYPPEKPQFQEDNMRKGNRPQQTLGTSEVNRNKFSKNSKCTSYTSLVSMAIDDVSCSSSECHSLHEEESPPLERNLMMGGSQQTLEAGRTEDYLQMTDRANIGVAGQLVCNFGDDADDASQYSFSSESSTASAAKTPIRDLVIKKKDSTVITVESRSASSTGQKETTIVRADKNTIVEKKAVPSSCIKFEKSSMAVFDQLVDQRSCLDTIVRSIRNFPGTDAAMQEWVCDALARWSCDELDRRLIVENGGFEIVLRAMTRHPTVASVQIQGCRALGNLCYDSQKNSILCREAGGVNVILHAMKTCHVIENVFSKACYALSMLLRNDPSGVEHLKDTKMVDIIVEGMIINNQSATVQRLGCAVLWHLVPVIGATLNPSYTLAEIVNIVVNHTLLCHLDDKNVQKYALALLIKCADFDSSEDKRSLSEIYEVDSWIILTMKVHPCESFIMEDGCSLLLSFMENFDKKKVLSMILTLQLESVLVDSIWTHRDAPQVVERVLAVLAALAGHDYKHAHCISSVQGSISAIVSVMTANAINTNLQYQACKCLSALSRHKDLQASIGSAGGIYAIVDAMRFHPQDVDVQVHAISALKNLCRIRYNAEMISLSDGIAVVERAAYDYPDLCKISAVKIAKMANNANRPSNRIKGGPLLQIKNCFSSLTTSFQNNVFHQKNVDNGYQNENNGVSVTKAKNEEKVGDTSLADETMDVTMSNTGNGRILQNEERASPMKKTREESQREIFPKRRSSHSKQRKSKLLRIGLFDSLKRWFNDDCEDRSLEHTNEPNLAFY